MCKGPGDIKITQRVSSQCLLITKNTSNKKKAVAILPSTAIYPQRLFCHELFVIGQSKWRTKHVTFGRFWLVNFKNQFKKFCTPRSLSPTLYTPFQCTLPHTFTYRACPFSVHCLSFNALASWDSNPQPWYLKTSALSTTPQCHWHNDSKYGYINTHEWLRQNRFQGQIAVNGKIATA